MVEREKKKILWVVYDFNQAGGQRYVYEICKALDKNKFIVDVLKVAPIGHDKNWDKEYYYQPTLDLGCKIYLLDGLLQEQKSTLVKKNFVQRGLQRIVKQTQISTAAQNKEAAIFNNFLSKYSWVNFSGINVFKTMCLSKNIFPINGIIHILTARFQDKNDIYEGFDKTLRYHFVSSFTDDILKFELAGFTNYQHTYFPLCFETIPYNVQKIEKPPGKYSIAVFTRLSSMKPLDPYFYAIKLLIEKGFDVNLRVYGAGDPEELGLIRQLNYLYIADRVSFPGHLDSIPDELTKADIDLIWYQSNNQLPAGYAALEIAMSGLPQIFWDFADMGVTNPIREIFPSFTSLTAFVEFSEELLNSKDLRNKLGMKQRNYIQLHNCSKTHIHILEEIFK